MKIACLALLVAALLVPAAAQAETFYVNNTADTDDATPDGSCNLCTLREAVHEANAQAGDDDVVLGAGGYEVNTSVGPVAGMGKLTIRGGDARNRLISGDGTARPLLVPAGAVAELSGLTIRDGKADFSGGGISNAGTLTLTEVTVTGNQAPDDGAGIANTGTLRLVRSTVSKNIASLGGGGIDSTRLSPAFPGVVELVNSTVSSNTSSGPGAGIGNSGGAVELTNSTITNNGGGTGHGLDLEGATATIRNSIITGNSAGDCRAVSGGSIASLGGNVGTDPDCGFGPARNALLAPLANNGGQTDTHALLAGSQAFNAGTAPGCPATDQRGIVRPQLGACDSGSFEVPAPPIVPDVTAPSLSNARFTRKRFRVGKAITALTAARRKRAKAGSTLAYTVSEPGSVSIRVDRVLAGRRKKVAGKTRCVKPTKRNRRARRCKRYKKVVTFKRAAKTAGAQRMAFSGRYRSKGRVRKLAPGSYRAVIVATDAAGNKSKAATAAFKIVR